MQKTILLFLSYLIVHSTTLGQTLDWVKSIGGPNNERAQSTVVDDSGNVYTTGYFKDTVDFDPNAGVANLISLFASDVFIQKLDSLGNLIWAKNMGGLGSDAFGIAVAVDDLGNTYVAGRFNGTGDFDPNAGITNLTSIGPTDLFIVKLDPLGDLIWANRIGGARVFNNETVQSIAIDNLGNVLLTGYFYGTVDFDPGLGVFNITSGGGPDVYILKLDSGGSFQWAKNLDGPSASWSNAVATDNLGNVLITGSFIGTIDLDPSAGIYNLTATGNNDIYILKLDASGNFMWGKRMGGTSYGIGYAIAVDLWSNVYTLGVFQDTVDFNPNLGTNNLISLGGADIFVQKLDASGNFQWAKSMGGVRPDLGYSIALDGFGNVYTTGYFGGTVDFNPGVGVYNLTANNSIGAYDVFIQKLDTIGNFQWAKSMGGVGRDLGVSINIDALGNIYTTGMFMDTVDFDPNIGVFNLRSTAGDDIFIQKLKPCLPSTGVDVISACDSIIWIDGNTYTTSNNTATHTLMNLECCDSVVSLDLTLMSIVLDTSKNETCLGDKDGFINTSVIGGQSPFSFVWNTTDTTNSISDLSAGAYALMVTDANGCVITWTDTLQASLIPSIAPFVGQAPTTDTTINWNDVILVDAGYNQAISGVLYSWVETAGLDHLNLDNDTASTTTINPQPSSSGTYNLLLTVTSKEGCIDTGSLSITVNIEEYLGMPNAFTPNDDGVNDFFRPVGLDDQFILEFKIFNRWGQLLFDGTDTSHNWDGTFAGVEQASEVYIYILRYQNPGQRERTLKGEFTLIR